MLMQTFALVVKMDQLLGTLVTTLIFVFIGLVIFSIAYGILSKVFHIHKEIEEDQNTALGIVIGSIMIGLALIISSAIQGS